MLLRVAINATPLLAPRTGIGNYIAELGAALQARGDLDLHSFYGYRWRHEAPVGHEPSSLRHTAARGLRELVKPWVPFKRQLRHAQQQIMFGQGLRKNHIDVYHEPNYVPIRYDVPVVVTVHDLSWLRFPEAHPRDRVRWLERGLPRALRDAAAILVDSKFVRDELTSTFPVRHERVHVVPLGVSTAFRPRTANEAMPVLLRLGLAHGRYLLSVGTIEPRKNLRHALQAFALLPPELQDQYPLVIAGARGWRAAELERELRVLTDRGQVRFLGHVADDDLVNLYAGAVAFIFPSLYEGFGLPPLEAMACGTPVLVSNRGSLPEVVADAGVMLDPLDPLETARQLRKLLEDPCQREEYARRGILRAARFTWAECAERTAAVLHGARA